MDFIRYVNSKDIRHYLYDIDYKLSPDQKIFIVLACSFIGVDEKVKALESYLQSSDDLPLTSITDEINYSELVGITSHEFIRRYISDVKAMTAFMKDYSQGYFYQAKIEYESNSDSDLLGYFKSFQSCFDAVQKYSKENQMGDNERFRIEKILFDDAYYCGDNYLSGSSYCFYSNNLQLMDIYVYDNNCKTYGVGIDGMYIGIPMPFKRGDIVTLGRNHSSVYLGYHPEKPEDYKQGRSFGDILYYGIYPFATGFRSGWGIPFSYELEYANLSLLHGNELKLIPLSKYLKGEIEVDEFYKTVRYQEIKTEEALEKEYLSTFFDSLEKVGINL
ncbi:hypothetical protein SAMN02745213_00332 [Succinivibrio dextrinosolvens DSM 3072]|uniref:Uncharacterized protein n=1 Tax=Succinivibrio dextrinosolvens DSM 3072 TaxID=1123324 RepID=A0A1T4UZ95_9GAMM|nr:hypothetical protein [Succinivibrio dextrinosolvens]SKA58063.1 hypothetical protein SAMN02745213_00332 [Succinivibrio dextrinosolvens DSM 3072]